MTISSILSLFLIILIAKIVYLTDSFNLQVFYSLEFHQIQLLYFYSSPKNFLLNFFLII